MLSLTVNQEIKRARVELKCVGDEEETRKENNPAAHSGTGYPASTENIVFRNLAALEDIVSGYLAVWDDIVSGYPAAREIHVSRYLSARQDIASGYPRQPERIYSTRISGRQRGYCIGISGRESGYCIRKFYARIFKTLSLYEQDKKATGESTIFS